MTWNLKKVSDRDLAILIACTEIEIASAEPGERLFDDEGNELIPLETLVSDLNEFIAEMKRRKLN